MEDTSLSLQNEIREQFIRKTKKPHLRLYWEQPRLHVSWDDGLLTAPPSVLADIIPTTLKMLKIKKRLGDRLVATMLVFVADEQTGEQKRVYDYGI